jgi:hypothetical protein
MHGEIGARKIMTFKINQDGVLYPSRRYEEETMPLTLIARSGQIHATLPGLRGNRKHKYYRGKF